MNIIDDKYKVRIYKLIDLACEATNIKPSCINNKTRKREYVYARAIICANLRRTTPLSLNDIAFIFKLNHSTIVNCIKVYNNLYETDYVWRNKMNKLERLYDDMCINQKEINSLTKEISNIIFVGKTKPVELISKFLLGK